MARTAPILLLFGCCTAVTSAPPMPVDLHSCSRPQAVRSTHLELDLELDFERFVARGSVTHHLDRSDPVAPLLLDTDGLAIQRVLDQRGEALRWSLSEPADPLLGAALRVDLRPDTQRVQVHYATAPDAAALQWLTAEQTNGGTSPFLFTQGQAILTRSWIPLQDSPAVRVTWAAHIQAPAGLVAVMSADQRGRDGEAWTFAMTRPVPPYLIALACGELVSRELGPRCAVWAEPAVVEAAAREFADVERMLAACERLFGPYRWGRYDVLVLPPSFPFGGMENPCLTFATPTILAGDRSLVALIAHELAHSWSGNLVSNATWRDFWLNEGFTVYLEHRIMAEVYGPDRAAMEIALGMRELREELAGLPPADQALHIDLTGRNPDDGLTSVPYQKGAALLRRLEQVCGRPAFDVFLRSWFDRHAFQSVTTATFTTFLQQQLLAARPDWARQIDLQAWIEAPGLPADAPEPASALFQQVDAALRALAAGSDPRTLDTGSWVTQQWLRFLGGLERPEPALLAELDQTFGFTRSGNSEILCAWLALGTASGYRAIDRRLELFLTTVGRRKFLKPLYEALLKTPDGRARALAIYARARPRYHAVTQRSLDALLDYEPR